MSEAFREFSREKVMIISAPNGARRLKKDHPALPMTADELAIEAMQLLEQQVSVLHLHVRKPDGSHSLDPDIYRQALNAITAAVGTKLIIQVTSEAAGLYKQEAQMDMVRELRPEAVSLALRELCPDESSELEAGRFYEFLEKERIWPQHILYTAREVERFEHMRQRGVFAEEHPLCLLVLGNYADEIEGSIEELEEMVSMADFGNFPWGACNFGATELKCMLAVTRMGGHVRLGFENNLWLEDGSLAGRNSDLIEQYRKAIAGQSRTIANADEVRASFLTNF
jgi:uncharacterized protein (DUF849 family)